MTDRATDPPTDPLCRVDICTSGLFSGRARLTPGKMRRIERAVLRYKEPPILISYVSPEELAEHHPPERDYPDEIAIGEATWSKVVHAHRVGPDRRSEREALIWEALDEDILEAEILAALFGRDRSRWPV